MGRPKRRRLGQNFLVDSAVAERIAAQLKPEPSRVLEIGPGHGALTEPLVERFDRVLALELDGNLVQPLKERFAPLGVDVRHADALKEDLDDLVGDVGRWQVASNLPYSVGTAILRRLLPRHDLFERLVVMLQREVAHRVVARPGGKGHGLLALEREAHGDARLVFDVDPRSFKPRPKIMSSVLVIDLEPPRFDAGALRDGLALAARALTLPRKMLSNSLGREIADSTFERADLEPSMRPGMVTLEGWVRLAEVG